MKTLNLKLMEAVTRHLPLFLRFQFFWKVWLGSYTNLSHYDWIICVVSLVVQFLKKRGKKIEHLGPHMLKDRYASSVSIRYFYIFLGVGLECYRFFLLKMMASTWYAVWWYDCWHYLKLLKNVSYPWISNQHRSWKQNFKLEKKGKWQKK